MKLSRSAVELPTFSQASRHAGCCNSRVVHRTPLRQRPRRYGFGTRDRPRSLHRDPLAGPKFVVETERRAGAANHVAAQIGDIFKPLGFAPVCVILQNPRSRLIYVENFAVPGSS